MDSSFQGIMWATQTQPVNIYMRNIPFSISYENIRFVSNKETWNFTINV